MEVEGEAQLALNNSTLDTFIQNKSFLGGIKYIVELVDSINPIKLQELKEIGNEYKGNRNSESREGLIGGSNPADERATKSAY